MCIIYDTLGSRGCNCVKSNKDSSNSVGKLDVSGNAEFECKIN